MGGSTQIGAATYASSRTGEALGVCTGCEHARQEADRDDNRPDRRWTNFELRTCFVTVVVGDAHWSFLAEPGRSLGTIPSVVTLLE
jgi:hypothetical protein